MRKISIKPGDKYGKLTIIKEVEKTGADRRFACECECGNSRVVSLNSLRTGNTKSCGCLHSETSSANGKTCTTHGMTQTKLYNIWRGMKKRCFVLSNPSFKDYGKRGISVCSEWLGECGSTNFIEWALSHGYREGLSIERVDVNKDYSPQNCTFIDIGMQGDNRRNSKRIAYNGKVMLLKEWADALEMNYGALKRRLQIGWSIEKSFTTPIAKRVKRNGY